MTLVDFYEAITVDASEDDYRQLMRRGVDINIASYSDILLDCFDCVIPEITPLFFAVSQHQWSPNAVRILLKLGADPSIPSRWDHKVWVLPIHISAHQNLNVIEMLARAGADISATTSEGNTALHILLKTPGHGHHLRRLFEKLLSMDIDTAVQNNKGQTVLHSSQCANDMKFTLIDHVTPNTLDIQDHVGNTALYYTAMNIFQSRIGVVYANRLMMAGASIRIRNDDGMTALEVDVTDFHVVGRCILTEEEERQNRCLAIGLGSVHRTGMNSHLHSLPPELMAELMIECGIRHPGVVDPVLNLHNNSQS